MNPLPCSCSCTAHGEGALLPLVQVIELKWLLAGEGIHVHVGRLQHDAVYARLALEQAAASANPTVRAMARRLCNLLAAT
jgi:hypothetical protein